MMPLTFCLIPNCPVPRRRPEEDEGNLTHGGLTFGHR